MAEQYGGDRALQKRILQAATVAGNNLHTAERLDNMISLDNIKDKVSPRLKYLNSVTHIGPDYRAV